MGRIHGVSGLLSALVDAVPDAPRDLAGELRRDRARIRARGERLRADIARLAGGAERAGLPFIPLKGSYLASERYRDLSLRPAADIDLLAPDDASYEAWSRQLIAESYAQEAESVRDRVFMPRDTRAPSSFEEDPDSPRPVELHRRLEVRLLGRSVDFTDLYVRGLGDGLLHGFPARLPDDGTLAIHLLVHAGPSLVGRGTRLIQLTDFTRLSFGTAEAGAAVELLGEAAWGLAALIARSLPGALPVDFLSGLERARPAERRARRWLARPGLMTGEAERTVLVLAEAGLCSTPADLARRVRDALPERSFLDRAYAGRGGSLLTLVRYYRDRVSR